MEKTERVAEQVLHTFYSDKRFVLKVVRWGDSPALLVKQKFIESEDGETRTRTAALNLKDIEIVLKNIEMLRKMMAKEKVSAVVTATQVPKRSVERWKDAEKIEEDLKKIEKPLFAEGDDSIITPNKIIKKPPVEKPIPPPARMIAEGSDKPE